MSKIRIVCFASLVVIAFSAFDSTSAFAEAEWLVEGKTFEGTLSAETEGELTLINFAGPTSSEILVEILCSGIFDGTISDPNSGSVSDLLNLEMVQIGENLEGEFRDCTVTHDGGGILDCKEGVLALAWVDNLNLSTGDIWETQLLLESGMYWEDSISNLEGKAPGYDVECETLSGATLANLCEGTIRALLENTATTPASVLYVVNNEEANRGNCTLNGEKTGEEETDNGGGNIWAIGEELERLETAVSEEECS